VTPTTGPTRALVQPGIENEVGPISRNPSQHPGIHGPRRRESLTPGKKSQVPDRARGNHGRRGGCGNGIIAGVHAGEARDMQRQAIDAEEGEEVEEQHPGHDAERDPPRPPEQTGAAYAAADRCGRRGPLLGHGAAFFLPGQRFSAGLATTSGGGAQAGERSVVTV
jgi:hypothetical protein